jgi:hypothetical protein
MHTKEQIQRWGGRDGVTSDADVARSTTFTRAEDCLAILIDETNRIHAECAVNPWGYELTPQVHNIGIVAGATSKTLLVNPSWLRFVVESDDFEACVADEIVDWYLIQELTGMEYRHCRLRA